MENEFTPSWTKTVVAYQIYPRSLKDTNHDGIGDLPGIIEKLDYLHDLGIGAIWLSPIYKSPMVDFGYDVQDYYSIDPIFGTMEDLDELINKAHAQNIKIVMDFIPNHTSDQHPWFLESKSSKNNPKRDWYIWKDPKQETLPPNNWLSLFGGSAWELDKITNQYYLHSFLKEQPDLNWRNPDVKEAMNKVLKFWLDKGVDGFRTDAIYNVIKDKYFLSEPMNPNFVPGKDDPYNALLHIYSQGQPEIFDVINYFCEIMKPYGDKFMISEVYLDLPELIKIYRACSNGIHSPFNLNLIGLPWAASVYKKFIDNFENSLKPTDLPNYVLGNHDRSRVTSRLGEQKARIAAILLLTLRGMPFIYYGDEIGMVDADIPKTQIHDPFEKNVPGFGLGRDPQRTPMQWDNSLNAGFTTSTPWLPINTNYKTINTQIEAKDPKSIFSLYKKLIQIRSTHAPCLIGTYHSLELNNPDIFGYLRKANGETVIVILNFSDKKQTVNTPFAKGTIIIDSYLEKQAGEVLNLDSLELKPNEGYVFSI